MTAEELKKKAWAEIDAARDQILSLGHAIYADPETGFKEFHTSERLAEEMEKLGLVVTQKLAYTGLAGRGEKRKEGPCIAVIGELDSLVNPQHPDAAKDTGNVHACGHNIQVTMMYAVARALVPTGILDELEGNVEFIGVPAEEYVELEYRTKLKQSGKIKYFAGKPQMVYEGIFDDVDMALMAHNYDLTPWNARCCPANTWNGFIGKQIRFLGKASHAGAAPWDGVNALNMAELALNNIHAQRETFRDDDKVRIHQIITNGGQVVNTVPSEVDMESTVRARNVPALIDANEKVNRSIHAAALALGGHAEIYDTPGQMPLRYNPDLAELFTQNARFFYKDSEIQPFVDTTASTDMGDLSLLMPILHSFSGGVRGGLHAVDYRIVDEEDAYLTPAKIFCGMLIDLLTDGAAKAKAVLDNFKPVYDKQGYLAMLDSMEQKITY